MPYRSDSTRFNALRRSLACVALLLASQAVVSAEPAQSLAEKRLSIFKGVSPGIVIIDFGPKPRTAASAPASAAEASEAKSVDAAAVQPSSASRFLSDLPPPSGRSLQSTRRFDAPGQGIVVPTASTAPKP